MAPDWFFANAARYDDYDRKGPKVFAGEYASHDHPTGKANNFLAALSEAAFMTNTWNNSLLLQCILGFPVITLQIGAGTRDKLPLLQSAELYLYLLRCLPMWMPGSGIPI